MPELAYLLAREGLMQIWNKNIEKVISYSAEELFHKSLSEFQDILDREKVFFAFKEVFDTGLERIIEYNILTKSGEKIPHLGLDRLAVVNGKEYLTGIAIEISKLKKQNF